MTREVSKEHERKLLLKILFPTPYAGYEHMLALFEICRELGDPYCLNFDEKGYTTDYKPFDSEEVISRVAKLLIDDHLLYYFERYKNKLTGGRDFKGKYYTYDDKTKSLKIKSEWKKLEEMLDEFSKEYRKGGEAVLRAIWEANVKLNKKYDNYYIVKTLAEKYGLGKGWFKILSSLEIIKVVYRHKGDIWISEELLPLVENVLQK